MFFREGFGQAKLPSWDRRGGAKRRGGTSQMRAKRASRIAGSDQYGGVATLRISLVPPRSPRSSARCPSYPRKGVLSSGPQTWREAETLTHRVFQPLAVVYFGQVCRG